jgi:ribosomal protein S18 acetylase RimI-like enzyme
MIAPDKPAEVRPARAEDVVRLGQLAAQLVRLHHGWDAARFFSWEPLEPGYGRFLAAQLDDDDAVVLVAVLDGAVAGYAYGRREPRDWNALLDRHGAFHDLFVDPAHRKRGIGAQLAKEMLAALEQKGVPRVVLSTAWKNEGAQKLFERLGFRRTMVEMTRERTEEL